MQESNEKQGTKKVYHKPEITTEPLCSDMALCTCDPNESKQDFECEMMGFMVFQS